jgi:hypothetical protein
MVETQPVVPFAVTISPGPRKYGSIDNLFHLYFMQNSLDYLQLLFLLAVRNGCTVIEGLNGLTATVTVNAFEPLQEADGNICSLSSTHSI